MVKVPLQLSQLRSQGLTVFHEDLSVFRIAVDKGCFNAVAHGNCIGGAQPDVRIGAETLFFFMGVVVFVIVLPNPCMACG